MIMLAQYEFRTCAIGDRELIDIPHGSCMLKFGKTACKFEPNVAGLLVLTDLGFVCMCVSDYRNVANRT